LEKKVAVLVDWNTNDAEGRSSKVLVGDLDWSHYYVRVTTWRNSRNVDSLDLRYRYLATKN